MNKKLETLITITTPIDAALTSTLDATSRLLPQVDPKLDEETISQLENVNDYINRNGSVSVRFVRDKKYMVTVVVTIQIDVENPDANDTKALKQVESVISKHSTLRDTVIGNIMTIDKVGIAYRPITTK